MATLQNQIADRFLEKLKHRQEVDAAQLDELKNLLSEGKKIKAEDLVRIFSAPAGGDIK
jgi:hypothetical protein